MRVTHLSTRRRPSQKQNLGLWQDVLGVAGHGCEVQLVLGPEDHVPRPDFQDSWRLERRGDGEQGQLRRVVLTVEELETPLDVQRLRGAQTHVSHHYMNIKMLRIWPPSE